MDEKKKKNTREVNTYDVPPSVAEASGITQVGLITLTADEELLCYKKSRGDNARLAAELAKACLVEATVNGEVRQLASEDATVDTFFKDCDPRIRQLLLQAYADLHAAEPEDTESFLKSRKLRVG
jgi:hypothetical protein